MGYKTSSPQPKIKTNMKTKPKIHSYIVLLPDGKKVYVKAHDKHIGTFRDSSSPATLLQFLKNDVEIMCFKEWVGYEKIK